MSKKNISIAGITLGPIQALTRDKILIVGETNKDRDSEAPYQRDFAQFVDTQLLVLGNGSVGLTEIKMK